MKKDILEISYIEMRDKLHRIAMKLLHNDDEAKDAVQDTFEKLLTKAKVESNAEARNKLVHILRNTCIDCLKHRQSIPLESIEMEIEYELPVHDIDNYEKLIIKGLTSKQMRIYHLITHDCQEYEDVAKQLNMTVDAVRMNMSRLRKIIRENIKMIDL